MKCIVCQKNNQKSLLKEIGHKFLYIKGPNYGKNEYEYDENGEYIPREIDQVKEETYQCSNGHQFKITSASKYSEEKIEIIKGD